MLVLQIRKGGHEMKQTKNLCAQIPLSLHNQVRAGQAKSGQTLSGYITEILTTYYEGGFTTMTNTRTLAFQISEELYQKIKAHLQHESQRLGRKVSQKEFVLGLIEQSLDATE